MNVIIRSGEAAFVPRARLLKLLGGELIRDEVMAVVELVKNSHDADAATAEVSISSDCETPSIDVRDDGHGMNLDDLLKHWMQPAGSSKRDPGRTRSQAGRRMLGEKGVGRFAVDRLGRHCQLISRRAGSDREIVAEFDWDQFDDANLLLSDVTNAWSERQPEIFTQGSGTLIRITGLRQNWNRRLFRRLASKLDRIVSPTESGDSFRIKVVSDEFPDYSGSFSTRFAERAPYRMGCRYDCDTETITIEFNGSERSLEWPGPGELWCGSLTLQLFGFDLDTESVRKVGHVRTVRSWLKDLSGISIYRDGFRLMPYGEPDDDWLRLDQRRINNPSHRFSNSQLIGQVNLTRDDNPMLVDQTNRGGLIENHAFASLRGLCHFLISEFEDRRAEVRESRPKLSRPSSQNNDRVEAVITELSSRSRTISAKAGEAFSPVLSKIRDVYRSEQASAKETERRLLAMAAVGLGSRHLFKAMSMEVAELTQALRDLVNLLPENSEQIERLSCGFGIIDGIVSASGAVSGGFDSTSSELDLGAEVLNFAGVHRRMAAAEGIVLTAEVPSGSAMIVKGRKDDLWRILAALLANAIESIGRNADGHVVLRAMGHSPISASPTLDVLDSGPGVPERIISDIFLDGFSTKERAAGMGLFVASRIAERNGWGITLCRERQRATGACFQVQFENFRSD
jgi:signal transduction histidine kinase